MTHISLEKLRNEKASLERKLTIVTLMINEYSENRIDLEGFEYPIKLESSITEMEAIPIDDFPYSKKWIDKILFLLDQKDRFLSNHELAESLMLYYKEYNIDKLKRKVSVSISAAYKKETVDGLIKVRVSNLPKGNVWGYKKWLDSDGEIIKEHRPFEMSDGGQYPLY